MSDHLEALVDSLLYEGYALYPYTPGATKNATPTPFGIVYPPAYAAELPSTFDHLQMECVVLGDVDAIEAEVRFLAASGERHKAEAQRLVLGGEAQDFEVGALRIRLSLEREGRRVRFRVENRTAEAGVRPDFHAWTVRRRSATRCSRRTRSCASAAGGASCPRSSRAPRARASTPGRCSRRPGTT